VRDPAADVGASVSGVVCPATWLGLTLPLTSSPGRGLRDSVAVLNAQSHSQTAKREIRWYVRQEHALGLHRQFLAIQNPTAKDSGVHRPHRRATVSPFP